MEALVPAFLLALLSQLGDKSALLTAMLADRYRRPWAVALGAGSGHALGNALAALGGAAVAHLLTPNAQTLMLAIALVSGGIGGFWPARPPKPLDDWRLGSFFTPLLGIFSLALGDRTQFFTFALAAGGMPWFAAAGAISAAFATALVAAMLGEAGWRGLPIRSLRMGSGLLFLVAGAYLALRAFGLTG